MTAKQIYDEMMSYGPEWVREFLELVKLYEESTPENKLKVLDMLRNGGKRHEVSIH